MSGTVGAPSERPTSAVLHVVVTCTERKTRVVEPELRVANISSASISERVEQWTTALANDSGPAASAEKLYAGDHWQVARSIAAESDAVSVNVWVASAGYGLVRMDTPMHAYAATFARRHVDCVVPADANFSAADWWRELARWRPAGYDGPRTLEGISATIAMNDASFLLISCSESYAAALCDDIRAAAERLPDRVGVVSVGSNHVSRSAGAARLAGHTVPGDVRLKGVVGGAMQSLNVRVTRKVVQQAASWFPSFGQLASLTTTWLEAAPPPVVYDRAKLSDDAMRQFIADAMNDEPSVSHTTLLRKLRDTGRACEQSRFRALFHEVKRTTAADSGGSTQPDFAGAWGAALPGLFP
jgi:hypothetical protein